MAIGSIGSFGTANSTSSGTTLVITTDAQLDAGNIGIVAIALDNTQTTDGNTSEVSGIVDSAGNTYTKLLEFCNGQGGAEAGATVSLWFTKAASTLASSGTITITFANTITSKAASAWEFTVGGGKTLEIPVGGTATIADDNDPPSNLVISGLASLERLYLRVTASERGSLSWVAGTNFTAITQAIANTGTNITSMLVSGEFRINTSTGETSNPTATTRSDCASVMVALEEVDEGVAPITRIATAITAAFSVITPTRVMGELVKIITPISAQFSVEDVARIMGTVSRTATVMIATFSVITPGISAAIIRVATAVMSVFSIATPARSMGEVARDATPITGEFSITAPNRLLQLVRSAAVVVAQFTLQTPARVMGTVVRIATSIIGSFSIITPTTIGGVVVEAISDYITKFRRRSRRG